MSLKTAGHLLTQRRFAPLFILLQTGTFNDNALKNALIALITFGGVVFFGDLPSAIRVPVAAFIFTGPFLIVSAIAGQIADKIDRGVILRWVKRAEILIMSLAAFGFLFENIYVLATALGFMGAQSAFFSPTKNAVLPQWLSEKELITGNALLNGFVFVFILIGQVVGTLLVLQKDSLVAGLDGPQIMAVILLGFALMGALASQFCPPAPAPKPDLKINFEPLSATWSVIAGAFNAPHVLRPMLGIAWFYGLSTVFVTTLPDYIANVMNFDESVLIVVLIASTLSIMIGSVATIMLERFKIWGPEAIGLVALGIGGVTIFTMIFCLVPSPVFSGTEKGSVTDFLSHKDSHIFIASLMLASAFNGIFVVPLQAMAQRRANPAQRARLMSAGAVLLNIFVNITTFALIGLAFLQFPPKTPFLFVIIGSIAVLVYALYRVMKPTTYESYIEG